MSNAHVEGIHRCITYALNSYPDECDPEFRIESHLNMVMHHVGELEADLAAMTEYALRLEEELDYNGPPFRREVARAEAGERVVRIMEVSDGE